MWRWPRVWAQTGDLLADQVGGFSVRVHFLLKGCSPVAPTPRWLTHRHPQTVSLNGDLLGEDVAVLCGVARDAQHGIVAK